MHGRLTAIAELVMVITTWAGADLAKIRERRRERKHPQYSSEFVRQMEEFYERTLKLQENPAEC